MVKFKKLLHAVNAKAGKIVSWLVLALVLVTAWDVFARYVFKSGSVALQEMEWHIFSVLFLLATGYTLHFDAHVRVDIVYARLSAKWKAAVDLIGSLVFLLPFCAVIIYASLGFVESSWALREGSGDPGGLPGRYILKSMIVIGFALLALQGVAQALDNLMILTGRVHPEPEDKGE